MKVPDWVKGAMLGAALVWSVPLLYFGFSYFVTMKIARQNFNEVRDRAVMYDHKNRSDGQIRANLARTQSDLRTYQAALEAYMIDNKVYPPMDRPGSLTTPINYIGQLVPDVFSKTKEPYFYYHANQRLLVGSRGPNAVIDLQRFNFQNAPEDQFLHIQYDPTNGVKSGGDVIRIKEPAARQQQ